MLSLSLKPKTIFCLIKKSQIPNIMNRNLLKKQLINYKQIFFVLICVLVYNQKGSAQNYPFDLPNKITSSINIETTKKEVFNNLLLGYNIEGFNTSTEKSFLKLVDPVTIRFPHGVWANFYEWEDDTYQQDSYDNGDHQAVLDVYVRSIKGHIGGIASLNTDKKNSNGGVGYDMMWTYSINFDDGPSSVARVKKDLGLGLEVKAIELGNEHFWKNQRSNRTATPADYLREASAVSKAIKAEFPEIQLSIPLGWRRSQGGYNASIIGDGNYFDAVTVHKYLGADPDKPGESDNAYSSLLTAKLELEEDVNWVRDNYAPGKPVWLTEWGVSAGSDVHGGACLGMADAYLYMSENQQIYERANWFSFNRILNAMVVVGSNRQPVYPLQQRGYLSTYNILKDVFRDATMLKTQVTSSTQLTVDRGSVNAVNARATTKDGTTTVVAINLTNKPVEFELKLDNIVYTGNFKHDALIFNDLGVVANKDFFADVLTPVKEGAGTITLPPLSISKITNIVIDTSLKIIAGTLEAEDFKENKQGIQIASAGNRTYLKDTKIGDWIQFDVNVTATGEYDFDFEYAAAASAGLISVEIDDTVVFDNFSLPQTSSASDFKNIIKESVNLTQGVHTLKINVQNGGFNLDKININYIEPLEAPTFVSLKDGGTIVAGSDIEVEASSSLEPEKIASMELFIDDVSVRKITTAPFKWGYENQNDALLENKSIGSYVLKLVLIDDENRTATSSITITANNAPTQPYKGTAHAVPGVIQLEDYDKGGEGFAFSDSTIGNSGGEYRTETGDDVDISVGGSGFVVGGISGGEYLRYTINVTEAGSYQMLVNYRTFSATSKTLAAQILPKDLSTSKTLFSVPAGSTTSGIIKIGNGEFGNYTSSEFDLQVGTWVLEFTIPTGGAGPTYDFITLNRMGALSVNDNIKQEFSVYPVPSKDGKFNLSISQEWEVYNLLGKKINSGQGTFIDISNFSKGLYFLRTETGVIKKLLYN